MAILINDTGSLWKTDGSAATTTQVPIYIITNWSFTDGTHELPPDAALVAIEPTTLASAAYLFTLSDASVATAQQASGGQIRISYWARWDDRGITYAADDLRWFPTQDVSAAGGRAIAIQRVQVRNNGDTPNTVDGFSTYVDKNTNGTDYPVSESIASIGFDQWYLLETLIECTNPGRFAACLNGVMIGEWHGANLIYGTSPLGFQDALQSYVGDGSANRPANIGVQVSPPFQALSGTDATGTRIAPRWDLDPSGGWLTRFLFHHLRATTAPDHGRHWYYASTGDASLTITAYSAADVPGENRVVATYGGGAGTASVISTEDVGALPYRARDGWASIVLKDYRHATNADFELELLPVGGVGEVLCTLSSVAGVNNLILNGVDTGIDLIATRYTFAVHLHQDGGCRVTVINNSSDGSSRFAWSAVGGDWTPASVGEIRINSAVTSGAATIDIGTVAVCRTWGTIGVDSLTHAATTGPTPNYPSPNHLTYGTMATPVHGIPGGTWPHKTAMLAKGWGRNQFVTILGRTGQTQANIYTNAIQYLTETRGMTFCLADGGSVNDVSGFVSIADADAAASYAASMKTVTGNILTTLIPKNEVQLCTMSKRTLLTGWNPNKALFVDTRNADLLALAIQYQQGGRILFSDTSSRDMDGQNNVHPTNQESYDINALMVSEASAVGTRSLLLIPGMGMGMGMG